MKKKNIEQVYILHAKIENLKKFLKTKQTCWDILNITKVERRYLLRSAYGIYNKEIKADSKLSELVTQAIKKRIEMYRDELRNLGVEVDE